MADLAELEIRVRDTGTPQVTQSLRQLDSRFTSVQARIISYNQALDLMARANRIAQATVGALVGEAIRFESGFTGVRKTVDGTVGDMARLRAELLQLSRALPVADSAAKINAVAEAAGQLGIRREAIAGFTRTMIELGESTNLTAEEAATLLGQFANITNLPQDQFDRLGSSIVALGNAGSSTERDIATMSLRIAGAGSVVGLSAAEITGMAAALANVGLEAEAGGSAISRTMVEVASAVATGSKELDVFAQIAGQTSVEFRKNFREDASGTITEFLAGLGRIREEGGNLFGVLSTLGLDDQRIRDALTRLANSQRGLRADVDLSTQAWAENSAMQKESAARFATTENQIEGLKNEIRASAIAIGTELLPYVNDLLRSTLNWYRANRQVIEGRIGEFLRDSASAAISLASALGRVAQAMASIQAAGVPLVETGVLALLLRRGGFSLGSLGTGGGAAAAGGAAGVAAGAVASGPGPVALGQLAAMQGFNTLMQAVSEAGRSGALDQVARGIGDTAKLTQQYGQELRSAAAVVTQALTRDRAAQRLGEFATQISAAANAAAAASRVQAATGGISAAASLATGASTFKTAGLVGVGNAFASSGGFALIGARLTSLAGAITGTLAPLAALAGAAYLAARVWEAISTKSGEGFDSPEKIRRQREQAESEQQNRISAQRAAEAAAAAEPGRTLAEPTARQRALALRQRLRDIDADRTPVPIGAGPGIAPGAEARPKPAPVNIPILSGAERAAADAQARQRVIDAEVAGLNQIVQLRQNELELIRAKGGDSERIGAAEKAVTDARLAVIDRQRDSLQAQLAAAQAVAGVTATDTQSAEQQIQARAEVQAITTEIRNLELDRRAIMQEADLAAVRAAQERLSVTAANREADVQIAQVRTQQAEEEYRLAQQGVAPRGRLLEIAKEIDALTVQQLRAERELLRVRIEQERASGALPEEREARVRVMEAQAARLDANVTRITTQGGDAVRNFIADTETGYDRLIAATEGWGNRFTDTLANAFRGGSDLWRNLLESFVVDLNKFLIGETITQPIFRYLKESMTRASRGSALEAALGQGAGATGSGVAQVAGDRVASAAEDAWTSAAQQNQRQWGGVLDYVYQGFSGIFNGLGNALTGVFAMFTGGGGGGFDWAGFLVNLAGSAVSAYAGSAAGGFGDYAANYGELGGKMTLGGQNVAPVSNPLPTRYHEGGIAGGDRMASDEVLAILKRGELVLPPGLSAELLEVAGRKPTGPRLHTGGMVDAARRPTPRHGGEDQREAGPVTVNMPVRIEVVSLDPRGAAEVIAAQQPLIENMVAAAARKGQAVSRAYGLRR